MAKELPYFKFEPNEWENGTVQMLSKDSKGLFIDVCSSYWSRLGELPYALALQKHCNGSTQALQVLIDSDIIGVIDGQIIIEFLDEQLNEFQETSEKRRNAANKRWSNANALQVQSKGNAIREEKRRENKKRGDKDAPFSFKDSLISLGADKDLIDQWLAVRKTAKATNTKAAFEKFEKEVEKSSRSVDEILRKCSEKSWRGFEAAWKWGDEKEDETKTVKLKWGN